MYRNVGGVPEIITLTRMSVGRAGLLLIGGVPCSSAAFNDDDDDDDDDALV